MREFILSSLIGIYCDANYLICCNLYSISVLFYCYINFVSLSFTFDKIWKGIVLIDFEKAQWADNIIVILKDGKKYRGRGAGILLAEDFGDIEYQFDTFYLNDGNNSIAFNIDKIKIF